MEMANLKEDHPPPKLMHKKGSPQCPMVLGTIIEHVGISVRNSVRAGENFDLAVQEEEQESSAEGVFEQDKSAHKRVDPNQDDLISLAHQVGAKVLTVDSKTTAAPAYTTNPSQGYNARGPSSQVRARVYRHLERTAEKNTVRSKLTETQTVLMIESVNSVFEDFEILPRSRASQNLSENSFESGQRGGRHSDKGSVSYTSESMSAADSREGSRSASQLTLCPSQQGMVVTEPKDAAQKLTALELINIFKTFDLNGDGEGTGLSEC
jgi:hypothetical protein